MISRNPFARLLRRMITIVALIHSSASLAETIEIRFDGAPSEMAGAAILHLSGERVEAFPLRFPAGTTADALAGLIAQQLVSAGFNVSRSEAVLSVAQTTNTQVKLSIAGKPLKARICSVQTPSSDELIAAALATDDAREKFAALVPHAADCAVSAYALYLLGRGYALGRGAGRDLGLATRYFEQSAMMGYRGGRLEVARQMTQGDALAPNPGLGMDLLELAALDGSRNAANLLASVSESSSTPAELRDPTRVLKALEFCVASAASGSAYRWCRFNFALYSYNVGDRVAAEKLLRTLSDEGNREADHFLARIEFAAGHDDKGAALMVAAAEAGLSIAAFELGQRYGEGRGVPADLELARHWLGRAVQAGHPGSVEALGALQ